MLEIIESASLLLFLLNPLFMSIYLLDIFKKVDRSTFIKVIIRGSLIAFLAFSFFAVVGEKAFTDVLHSRFFSFQIFGGLIFLLIGIKMVFDGTSAIVSWRGEAKHLAGAIAMPFFIGPGTIMASVLIGANLGPTMATVSIGMAVILTTLSLVILKWLYDILSQKREELLQGYVNIVGRLMALVVGTFSVEMIITGIEGWLKTLS